MSFLILNYDSQLFLTELCSYGLQVMVCISDKPTGGFKRQVSKHSVCVAYQTCPSLTTMSTGEYSYVVILSPGNL